MAADADNDAPQEEETPKKKTTRRRTPAKEAAAGAEAESPAAESEQAAPAEQPEERKEDAGAPEPAAEASADHGAAEPAGPNAWDKTLEKVESVDWDYRGRAVLRAVLMVLAAFGVSISASILYALAFVQFIYTLITTEKLSAAIEFSARLAVYVHQLLDFISYRNNEHIFPLAPFPDLPEDERPEHPLDPGENSDQKAL